jgi:ElaA protein
MMHWEWCKFADLGSYKLYAVLTLRVQVFVVEQTCPYQETDGLDQQSMHLMGWQDNQLVAYARVLPLDLYQPGVVSLGRVVVAKEARGLGLGKQLVKKALAFLEVQHNTAAIKIAAQYYLENFYREFGFVSVGKPYNEDGILHIAMLKTPI